MNSEPQNHAYRLAWGLIALIALGLGALAYAIARSQIVSFTLQPKPPAKPTTSAEVRSQKSEVSPDLRSPNSDLRFALFHDTTRQPESEQLSALTCTAPRIARVVDCFPQPSRGSFRALLHDNQAAGTRDATGARFSIFPGESNGAGVARPTLPAACKFQYEVASGGQRVVSRPNSQLPALSSQLL